MSVFDWYDTKKKHATDNPMSVQKKEINSLPEVQAYIRLMQYVFLF